MIIQCLSQIDEGFFENLSMHEEIQQNLRIRQEKKALQKLKRQQQRKQSPSAAESQPNNKPMQVFDAFNPKNITRMYTTPQLK